MRKLKITAESLQKRNIEGLLDCLVQVKYMETDKKLAKYQKSLIVYELCQRYQADLVKALIRHAL
jgi:hypothetical protein